jgi:hypothetical protein
MLQFFERIGIVKNENSNNFKMVPAIVMMLLLLTFVGATIYILVSSLSY